MKVRFDNKAGTQVKVIPSKGQNKNEGYTVQAHMTLDLNFEEKGQQNDIPISFKVDNPWSSSDKLLMNGQQGSVTVVPSPNKDDIKLVTITAACKYLLLSSPVSRSPWLLNKRSEDAFFTGFTSIWSKYIHKFQWEEDLFITLSFVYFQMSNTYLLAGICEFFTLRRG